MPNNTVALVMKAEGISCTAKEAVLDGHLRGIVSYYAAATLARAITMRSWLGLIEAMVADDLRRHRLDDNKTPSLQVLGDASSLLPGSIGVGR